MASNFEKRKAVTQEIEAKRTKLREKGPMEKTVEQTPVSVTKPVYTQTGYDIFTPDGGKTYKVAEISYNPITGVAEVKEIFNITRLVALQYFNTKTALQTLKRKAIKD